MLGGVRERAGDASGAAALYTAALKACADGQSAFVALSALQHRTGRRSAAADAIDRLFARRLTVDADDPWWRYRFGRWQEAEPELAALRAEARR